MDIAEPVYVGHSHLATLMGAAKRRRADLSFISLREMTVSDAAGDLVPELRDPLAGRIVVSTIGGNAHNGLGLLNIPPTFDFAMRDDDYPGLIDLASNARVIPYMVVRDALVARTRRWIGELGLIAQVAKQVIHIESPPPIEDDDYIVEHANRVFVDRKIDVRGVVSPTLRLEFWRLHSAIMRDACEARDVRFLPAPEAAVDRGFLRPDLVKDATHGSADYGELVLQQIEAL